MLVVSSDADETIGSESDIPSRRKRDEDGLGLIRYAGGEDLLS